MGPQQVTVMALDAFCSMLKPLSCFGRRAQPPHLGQLALRPIPGEGRTGARPSQVGVEVVAGNRADRAQRSAGPRPRTVGLSEEKCKGRLGPTAIGGGPSKRQWVLSFAPHPNASPRRGEGLQHTRTAPEGRTWAVALAGYMPDTLSMVLPIPARFTLVSLRVARRRRAGRVPW